MISFRFYSHPPRWLIVMLLSPRTPVWLRTTAAAFLMATKGKNTRVINVSALVQVVEINPDSSTTARLVTCVVSVR